MSPSIMSRYVTVSNLYQGHSEQQNCSIPRRHFMLSTGRTPTTVYQIASFSSVYGILNARYIRPQDVRDTYFIQWQAQIEKVPKNILATFLCTTLLCA